MISPLLAVNCTGEQRSANSEAEMAIYNAVLKHIRIESIPGDSIAIYPRFIAVDPENGPAPGHEPEHYLRGRSDVLKEVVASSPGFILCSADQTGRCPQAIDGQHITLSAIQVDGPGRATVWVMITDLTPRRGSILYKLAKLDYRTDRWEVISYTLVSAEHMF